ncbi:MAG: histidine phosphatase family protein [Trueperaceae bacterium]|nr:MAG: histidine phosphatase family protein [Trueperaceae bacterium]
MKVYFIRHGETDWELVQSRGIRGWATSFAPLTPLGRLQIDTIARDFRLQDCEAILCSSYARALESAALLSRALNKPLYVEYDLHEWLPQKNSLADIDQKLLSEANETLRGRHLRADESVTMPWESLDEVRERVLEVLSRYQEFNDVIVVTHAVVISSLIGMDRLVEYAEIVPCEIDPMSSTQKASVKTCVM